MLVRGEDIVLGQHEIGSIKAWRVIPQVPHIVAVKAPRVIRIHRHSATAAHRAHRAPIHPWIPTPHRLLLLRWRLAHCVTEPDVHRLRNLTGSEQHGASIGHGISEANVTLSDDLRAAAATESTPQEHTCSCCAMHVEVVGW